MPPDAPDRTILLLGPTGQIGHVLQHALAPLGAVVPAGRDRVDLTRPGTVRAAVREAAPDLVVNAAGYTAVDRAEDEASLARQINAEAPGVLAEAAQEAGAWLVHYSTDYVFDGTAARPYREADPANPQGVYAQTKRDGEAAIQAVGGQSLILRTSWVYSARRSNFLRTMLRLADEQDTVAVVDDQIGCPTWAGWVAAATASVLRSVWAHDDPPSRGGLYHLCSSGQTSWYGFARAIFAVFDRDVEVRAIASDDYPRAAPRPAYSVLDTTRVRETFGLAVPTWSEQLAVLHDQMARSAASDAPRASAAPAAEGEAKI